MKICERHLRKFILHDLDKETLSKKLFQLGHENEIINDIIDIELTPNRGDCLSLLGMARDLNVFYKTNLNLPIYQNEIEHFNLQFKNEAEAECPSINFLNISVKELPDKYISEVESYFIDLNLKKNNFFTDISNYVAYEMGQPTHCYDLEMIDGSITLSKENTNENFMTLLDQEIPLKGSNLIFRDNKNIINLAGIIGGKKTSCGSQTKSVIVESAYFNPESIIGKSIKYNINSEAAHKFERGVDPLMQEKALRRFIYLVKQHVEIENLQLYKYPNKDFKNTELDSNISNINKILGTDIKEEDYLDILIKLGFKIDRKIIVPSYRFDISHENDLAEEIARTIGYDQIKPIDFKPFINPSTKDLNEDKLKQFLKDNGFYEVINMPFAKKLDKGSITIDNPLDSNRNSFRTGLASSLVQNLDFNERRQKDSIKLFEISDVYSNKDRPSSEKKISLIVSGRQGNNYSEFSKKLDKKYLVELFNKLKFKSESYISSFSRNNIDSKIKNPIFVFEANFEELINNIDLKNIKLNQEIKFNQYKDISEYPSTTRDISFSIKSIDDLKGIEEKLLGYQSKNLKSSFIFDFYNNEKEKIIKVGFRFIFQSKLKTLEEKDIKTEVENIISLSKEIAGANIPGLE